MTLYSDQKGRFGFVNWSGVGIGTSTPAATLHVAGNQILGSAAVSSSTDNVSQMVRDNSTGEIKIVQSSTGNTKAFNSAHYSLQNVQSDFISNFDTQIPVAEYTVIITGASFTNKQVLQNTSGQGYYNPLNFRAYNDNGTWRLTFDYVGGQTTDGSNGNWEVDVLIISNSVVKALGTQSYNLGGNNAGTGSRPSGL